MTGSATIEGIEQFLYREARLLDTGRLQEWLDLFAEDGCYWVPLEAGQRDPYETSSIIFDDRVLLEARVRQYSHPRAHARNPLARTVHQIGNVQIAEQLTGQGEVVVTSTLVLVEYRAGRQRVFGALCEHRLRGAGDGWMIVRKRVDLVNSESELDGIAILL